MAELGEKPQKAQGPGGKPGFGNGANGSQTAPFKVCWIEYPESFAFV